MTSALQESTARAGQAIQESRAGQAWQEATTKACNVCDARTMRVTALECKECSATCCQKCVTSIRLWNPTGEVSLAHPGPSLQVCNRCVGAARQRIRAQNVQERMKRTVAYLEGRLEPYKYSPESKAEQSLRIGGHVMYGLKSV